MKLFPTLDLLLETFNDIEGSTITHVIVRPDVSAFLADVQVRQAMGKPLTKRALRRMGGRAHAAMTVNPHPMRIPDGIYRAAPRAKASRGQA